MATQSQLDADLARVEQDRKKRAQLVAFYEKHDPAKIEMVDQLLSGELCTFEQMLSGLHNKYGELPEGWDQDFTPSPWVTLFKRMDRDGDGKLWYEQVEALLGHMVAHLIFQQVCQAKVVSGHSEHQLTLNQW